MRPKRETRPEPTITLASTLSTGICGRRNFLGTGESPAVEDEAGDDSGMKLGEEAGVEVLDSVVVVILSRVDGNGDGEGEGEGEGDGEVSAAGNLEARVAAFFIDARPHIG